MQTVSIEISKSECLLEFKRDLWKMGRMLEPSLPPKQVYNLQADDDNTADAGLMEASFERYLWEGVEIMSEYLSARPSYGTGDESNTYIISLVMPESWVIHSAPGLKYELKSLIHNGMMADWCDSMKPDSAKAYRLKAELNKAKIQSSIYALNPPSLS